MIRHLRLQIAKLRHEQYGHSAERHARLIELLEMQLEDIETDIGDDCARAEAMTPKTSVTAFERRAPPASHFPNICPASVWWLRRRPPAPAVDRRAS